MRVERREPPWNAGNIAGKPIADGSRCRCGKVAIMLLANAYRQSTVCDSPRCRRKEIAWVGNMVYVPPDAPLRKGKDKAEPRRGLDVRTGERRPLGAARRTW